MPSSGSAEWFPRAGRWPAFNGYGYGTYIDRLGRAYSVYYELVDENTIRIYGASLGELWLTADFETGAFVSSTEAPAA